ncbi:MAG: CoA transferase [Dehalococcoidia bacterium]
MKPDWSQPLSSIQVLDLSEGVAAGFTARLFAQLGAKVRRGRGATLHDVPYETQGAPEDLQIRVNRYLHRGKVSFDLDDLSLSDPANLAPLAKDVDVVIHDRGETFGKALLNLPAERPLRVISLSPLGWSGPYKDWAADGLLVQALAGIATLVGSPKREPLMLPGFTIQYAAGSIAFIAGMAMLLGRNKLERHVHVTEFETGSTLHQFTYLAYTRLGWVRKRGQFMLPTATYMKCSDGQIVIAAVKPNHWSALAIACGRADLLERPGLGTFLERRLQSELVESALAPWFEARSAETAFEELCSVGVPAAILKGPGHAAGDPQFKFRHFVGGDRMAGGGLPVPFLLNGVRPGKVAIS